MEIKPEQLIHQLSQNINNSEYFNSNSISTALFKLPSTALNLFIPSSRHQHQHQHQHQQQQLTQQQQQQQQQQPKQQQPILKLNPHHLYYLLLKFDQLGLQSIPLEQLNPPTSTKSYHPSHWTSNFNPQSPTSSSKDHSDATSLFSNFSNLSISSTSSLWSSNLNPINFTNTLISTILSTPQSLFGTSQPSDHQPKLSIPDHQLKFLYSTFTRIPSLSLGPSSAPTHPIASSDEDLRKHEPLQLIEGFGDLPNHNLVPLSCFKSLTALYLLRLDPRMFSGWDALSQSLRRLEIRSAGLDDLDAFLLGAVRDDLRRLQKRFDSLANLAAEHSSDFLHQPLHLQSSHLSTSTHDLPATSDHPSTQDCTHHEHSTLDLPSTPVDPSTKDCTQDQQSTQDLPATPDDPSTTDCTHDEQFTQDVQDNPLSDSLPPGFPSLSWAFLQHLCLADNSLTFLPTRPLKTLTSLVSLDLSSNLLIAIPAGLKVLPRLKLLNLAANMIDSVLGIALSLPRVTTVNLSRNRLRSLCGMESMASLERLDIRANEIQDISELSRLARLAKLTSLWASENPSCSANARQHRDHPDWRTEVFSYFSLERRAIDGPHAAAELPIVNLKLENVLPTHAERKAMKRPPRPTPSPERPVAGDVERKKTVVRPAERRRGDERMGRTAVVAEDAGPGAAGRRGEAPTSARLKKSDRPGYGRRRPPRIVELDGRAGAARADGVSAEGSPRPRSECASPPLPRSPILNAFGPCSPAHASFRSKIEALRVELGDDAWLRVLSESEFASPRTDSPTVP